MTKTYKRILVMMHKDIDKNFYVDLEDGDIPIGFKTVLGNEWVVVLREVKK